ncbi:MAG: hypothetical protein V4510_07800 [bacterium]
MAYADLVAAVGIFLPTAALIWFMLGRYEGYFEDNRLFFAMGAGIFAALVVRFLEVRLFGFEYPQVIQGTGPPFTTGTLVYSFAYTALGYGLIQTLAKTSVLGFRKFRMRKDSAYYGAALGLAFGAMWATEFAAANIVSDGGRVVTETPALILDASLLLVSFGLVLAGGASGTWIGREVGEGRLWRGSVTGSLWIAPGLALMWFWLRPGDQVIPALASLGWGIFALVYTDKRILQVIVPPEVRDMIRKERRRERRKTS